MEHDFKLPEVREVHNVVGEDSVQEIPAGLRKLLLVLRIILPPIPSQDEVDEHIRQIAKESHDE